MSNWLQRKALLATLSLLLVLIQSSNCYAAADTGRTSAANSCPADVISAAVKLNDFSLKILKELVQERNSNDNVVFAPIGLAACTSVLAEGAKGKTQVELLKALSLDKNFSPVECSNVYKYVTRVMPEIDLTFASSIYGPTSIKFDPSFNQKFNSLFNGKIQTASTPNALSRQIVEWVKTQSKNMIVLNSNDICPSSIGVINVLYFKAFWKDQFEPAQTKIENFTKSDNSTMTVDMMHKNFYSVPALYGETGDSEIIKLPYRSGRNLQQAAPFSMYIILPKSGKAPQKILGELTAAKLNARIGAMQYKLGSLALPRFAISADSTFKSALQKNGVQEAFTPQADFTKITKLRPAYFDEMSQKLRLIVNERGTEASAFTQAILTLGGGEDKTPFNMVVNRPFIVIVRDEESNAILLIGIIRNPERDKESTKKIVQEFTQKVNELEERLAKKSEESSFSELQYSCYEAREFFDSCEDFIRAKEYSSKLLALAKSPLASSRSNSRISSDLYRHAEIELRLDEKASATKIFNQLIELYFQKHANGASNKREIGDWQHWEELLEKIDKKLSELNQDKSQILSAKESVLKESIRDRARHKEWHYGAWRRKLTTIGIPDKSAKIDFRLFMNCYKENLKTLAKDTATMQSLQRNNKDFLKWSPTFQSEGYDDLGIQQTKLANVYLEMKKPELAVPFLELSILNFFEDRNSNSVATNVTTLVDILKKVGRTSEANELSATLNNCKSTCNTYLALHKKWQLLQEKNNELYRAELKRQEQEDWEREKKNAK